MKFSFWKLPFVMRKVIIIIIGERIHFLSRCFFSDEEGRLIFLDVSFMLIILRSISDLGGLFRACNVSIIIPCQGMLSFLRIGFSGRVSEFFVLIL